MFKSKITPLESIQKEESKSFKLTTEEIDKLANDFRNLPFSAKLEGCLSYLESLSGALYSDSTVFSSVKRLIEMVRPMKSFDPTENSAENVLLMAELAHKKGTYEVVPKDADKESIIGSAKGFFVLVNIIIGSFVLESKILGQGGVIDINDPSFVGSLKIMEDNLLNSNIVENKEAINVIFTAFQLFLTQNKQILFL